MTFSILMLSSVNPNLLVFNNFILEDVTVLDKIDLFTLLIAKKIYQEMQNFKFSHGAYFCNTISKLETLENERSSYKKQQ